MVYKIILNFKIMTKKICAMDLFAGCGGLSLGLKAAGISVKWANECDEDAAESYKNSHSGVRMINSKIEDLYLKMMNREVSLPTPGDLDLLVGGPPCQGFSGYNRHRKATDPRNSMVDYFLDFVVYLKPRFVLMENVPGMLSMENGKIVKLLLSTLEDIGYDTRLGILQAGNYGLPQNRWRVFIIAAKKPSRCIEFPNPTHSFPRTTIFGATQFRANVIKPPKGDGDLFSTLKNFVTVGDAIKDLPEIVNGCDDKFYEFSESIASDYQCALRDGAKIITDHQCNRLGPIMLERCVAVPKRPGAGWLDLPDHLKPKNLAKHGDKRYDNRFGRLHWEGTFNTILTKPEPYWGRVLHPEQDRVVSVRECARAQGFPDTARFSGKLASRYKQIGNAVPPPLAKAIAEEILKLI